MALLACSKTRCSGTSEVGCHFHAFRCPPFHSCLFFPLPWGAGSPAWGALLACLGKTVQGLARCGALAHEMAGEPPPGGGGGQ